MISPGFVDIHAHSGLLVLADKAHEAKVLQGVTTELVGVDGLSYAPFHSNQDLLAMVRMNAGLDGDPPLDYAWGTVSEYLQLFDQQSPTNTALLIGNTPLRINAIGWSDVTSTTSATAEMRAMLRAAMEEGAFGLSSGLDYPPGCFADTDELVALANEAASLGASITLTSAIASVTAIWTRTGRPSRLEGGVGPRSTSPTLLPAIPTQAHSDCSSWSSPPARRISTSHSMRYRYTRARLES